MCVRSRRNFLFAGAPATPIALVLLCLAFIPAARADCVRYEDGAFSTGGVDTPDFAWDVAVSGTFGYIADGSAMRVVDLSLPELPEPRGVVYQTQSRAIAASGATVFLAAWGSGLKIIDASDPWSPHIAGTMSIPYLRGVAAAGTTVYTSDDTYGLSVIDASDPSNPILLGRAATPGAAIAVAVAGGLACVADGSEGLRIFDVSDPRNPREVGSLACSASNVFVSGARAYVVGEGTFLVVDLSTPSSPVVLGTLALGGFPQDVKVAGSTAFVAGWEHGLEIIDVSAPSAPALVRAIGTGGYAGGVALRESIAYVAAAEAGLRAIDTANPPADGATLLLPGHGVALDTAGDRAFIGAEGSDEAWLFIADLSDPAAPEVLGTYDLQSVYVGCLAADGPYAYVGMNMDFSRTVQIIDASDPAAPYRRAYLLIPGSNASLSDVTAAGGYLYLAGGSGGFYIIDVRDPSAPAIRSHLTPTTFAVALAGSNAYIAGPGGFSIVNVADPSAPVVVGSAGLGGSPQAIAVRDGTAYIASSLGLQILDVANPAAPHLVGSETSIGPCEACAVNGTYAYLSSMDTGLHVVDIGRADAPLRVAGANTLQLHAGLHPSAGNLLVADGLGLRVWPIECPTAEADEAAGAGRSVAGGLIPSPNPAVGGAEIRLVLPVPETLDVRIYDVGGRLRRHLFRGMLPQGVQTLRWDGADDHGAPVGAGGFLLRAEGEKGVRTGRVVLVR